MCSQAIDRLREIIATYAARISCRCLALSLTLRHPASFTSVKQQKPYPHNPSSSMVFTITIPSRLVIINIIIPVSCAAMPSRGANLKHMRPAICDVQAIQIAIYISVIGSNQPRFKQQIVRFSRASVENCLSDTTCTGTYVCISFDDGIGPYSLATRSTCACLPTNLDDLQSATLMFLCKSYLSTWRLMLRL